MYSKSAKTAVKNDPFGFFYIQTGTEADPVSIKPNKIVFRMLTRLYSGRPILCKGSGLRYLFISISSMILSSSECAPLSRNKQ